MTVGEFKKYLEQNNVTDDMPILLIDTTTDDIDDRNYSLSIKDNLDIDDTYPGDDDYPEGVEYGTPIGKGVIIYFDNKLNENPI